MRILSTAAATIVGLSAALLSAPTAGADESAADVIGDLRGQGYNVVIDRVGTGSLDRCVVTDVRNPTEIERMRIAIDDDAPTPIRQTITVSLNCTG